MARRRKHTAEIDQRPHSVAEKAEVVPLSAEDIEYLHRQFTESFEQPLIEKRQTGTEEHSARKRFKKK